MKKRSLLMIACSLASFTLWTASTVPPVAAQGTEKAQQHDPNPSHDPDVQRGYDENQREHGKGDSVKPSSGTVIGNPPNGNVQGPNNSVPYRYIPLPQPVRQP